MNARQSRTRTEIVETALKVMSERGAAGLSLGEVANRMGMKTPSLYGYYASKAALCDEIFSRGWRELNDAMTGPYEQLTHLGQGEDVGPQLLSALEVYVRWALEHAAAAQLMFWRPIQGWEPGQEAYTPAVEALASVANTLGGLQGRGVLRADADVEEMTSVLTVLGSGVITQQLSNEPAVPLGDGRHSHHLPALAEMFLQRYAVPRNRGDRGEK